MHKYYYISSIIKYLTGLLEIVLGARVVLKFLGASSKALIVELLYKTTDFIIAPFKFIFPNVYVNKGVVDFTTLSAMLGYLILVLVILKFLRLILIRPLENDKPKH
ncbi:MAG: YggT family protein [Patescibacteria group bacterium]|nr:YggT family protein [Patescibacteria group bacterium]